MSEYVEIVPLGGVGEFGMNCAALRCEEGLILVDAGMTFPSSDSGGDFGVNVVVPEIAYLRERRDDLLGIFLTHGHEDHIGATAYILEEIQVPVYGNPLTLGLVENRLKERGLREASQLIPIQSREVVRLGPFEVEPIRLTHSFPESFAYSIVTPAGRILWTGDFKFDQTPIDGQLSDVHRLASCGEEGVLALFSDSTNSVVPGLCPSEHSVRAPLRSHFLQCSGRIVISCFSTSIHRMQIVLDLAREFGRRVAPVGRSLIANLHKAAELGYLKIPEGVLASVGSAKELPARELAILASGSQGEPMSAMSRLAVGELKGIEIQEGDLVILSARLIPGNEKRISRLIDHFYRRGARVVDSRRTGVHASGHGCQEDLKLMINLTRPRHFVPIHGDYRQLKEHCCLAQEQGIEPERIHLIENGDVLRLEPDKAYLADKVTVGRRFIDEGRTGEVHEMVLRDRRYLSEDGFLVIVLRMDRFGGDLIGDPELISRGFVMMEESENLVEETRGEVIRIIEETPVEEIADEEIFKEILRKGLKRYLRKKTGKRPMILPVTLEI